MKKQTAVDWYNTQLNLYGDMAFNKEISLGEYHIKKMELLEQAKRMEKEQMKEIYGNEVIVKQNGHHLIQPFEQYYNETYGGQDESK
jgi:hypothetical protein